MCAANVLGMRRPSKGRHANMFFTRTDTECPVWMGNPDVFESQVMSCDTAFLSSELLRSWQVISLAIQQMYANVTLRSMSNIYIQQKKRLHYLDVLQYFLDDMMHDVWHIK